jgi:hypothetical protein
MEGSRNKDKESGDIQSVTVSVNVDEMRFEKDRVVAKYSHVTTYAPEVATFKVVGELYLQEDAKRKDIEDQWKKAKQLSPEFAEEILTNIQYSATAVGTLVAFGLGISAPINIPRARIAPAPSAAQNPRPAGAKAG